MCNTRAFSVVIFSALVVLHCGVTSQVYAQGSNATSRWRTLSGDPPFVVARGGFSGLFPDSSSAAYSLALLTSVPDVILWCDVQLTKDVAGICFSDLKLDNGSNIVDVFKSQQKTYLVNGVPTPGWFSIDYTLRELSTVSLNQGIYSRTNKFDGNAFQILTVEDVARQLKPPGLWLNIQHDAFYAQHNLSMRSFVLSVYRRVIVSYISSPEVNFLKSIVARFRRSTTKLCFRFLGKTEIEPTTNLTYGSLLNNLTYIKTFASGILVPKDYIWPVDASQYLFPHTSVVLDAHKEGLEVFASGFANDIPISFNYSYDPLAEYVSVIDNGDFSVDGVLSDFPITPSEAIDCFSDLGKNASKQVNLLVISKNGASGDYPSCTDEAYLKAISDGADIIDCPVQMSKDGVPFCFSLVNLMDSTNAAQSSFSNLATTIPEIMASSGIFSFSLTWEEIKTLKPQISNPFSSKYKLSRSPKNKNAGKFIKLSDFLDMAKNASSLSGVLISIENAAYLAEKQGMGVTDAVIEALGKAGYDNKTALKVMIQSTNSSVLTKFKEKNNYEFVYKIEENIRGALNTTIEDIKKFAGSVVLNKDSIFPENEAFITGATNVVQRLQSFNLSVYVETFSNEFVSQAWDFFSDATVEINSHYMGAGINGVITDFPMTAARYRRNRCLNLGDKTPAYMSPVEPGSLINLVTTPYMPPSEAPNPLLTESDVMEPPLPPVTPVPGPSSSNGSAPRLAPPPNGQPKVAAVISLSAVAMLLAALLLL